MHRQTDVLDNYNVQMFTDQKVFALNVVLDSKVDGSNRFSNEDVFEHDIRRFVSMMNKGNQDIFRPVIEIADEANRNEIRHLQVSWHRRYVLIAFTFVDENDYRKFVSRAMAILLSSK